MTIGTVVRVISGMLKGETGVIINTGEGWSCEHGSYIIYAVQMKGSKRVYQFKANEITAA